MSKKLLRKKLALMLANLKKKRRYYCEVESLQNKTTSDYISTGIYYDWSQNATVNTVFSIPSLGSRYVIAGSYSGSGLNLEVSEVGTCRMYGNGGTPNVYTTNAIQANEKVEIIFKRNYPGTEMTVITPRWTETVSLANITQTAVSATTLNLFRDTRATFGLPIIYKFYIKMGNVEKDFIPILDWDYHPCMYEKNASEFYYDENSSDMYGFIAGREIHYVDYLEADGTQYIDTGYKANSNTKIDIDFTLNSHENSVLFGGRTTAEYNSFFVWSEVSALNCCRFDYTYRVANNRNGGLVQLDTKSNIVKDKEKNYLNGIQYQSNSVQTFQTAHNAYLFAGNNGGTANYFHKGKIFSAKIYDDDNLIRNYLPAIDENGVGFMFDKASHSIYDNAGTGAFKYPVRETEYIEVTNLGTNNQNPCIDLGLKYKSSMSIESKYTRTEMGVSGSVLPLSNSTAMPLIYMPALNASAKTDRFVWRRSSLPESSYYYNFDSYPMTVEFKVDAVNDALIVNGSVVKTGMIASMNGYTDPYESYSTLYMLSIDGTYGGMGKVYYLKLYDTTQVYRDLIPVWKDGLACMYDKQNNVYYSNTKTGTVICGKIVEPEYE